jgi:tetratricopeptide (TPR) repeat protein
MTTLLWESSEAFRRAGEIDEFKRLQAACAEALGAQGRLGDGVDLCRKALEKPELKRRTGLFQKAPRYDAGDVALSLVMTDLLRRSGDFKSALKEVQRLSSMAEATGDQALAAKAEIEAALVHEVAGDLQEAMRVLNGAEGTLRSLGDSAGLVAVYLRKGTVQEKLGDEAAAAKHYQEAARHAEIANDQYALTVAKDNLRALTGSG